MDETFHESESTTGGAVPPPGDAATSGAQTPHIAHFAPVEAPEQAAFPAGPPGHHGPAGDGFPGGEIPESSGFSWRLPGQQMPTQQVQGGIPNEFDHLFRDAPQDDRRSLMPSQGPIGVSLQAPAGYPSNGAGRSQPPAVHGGPPPGQSGPAGQSGPQPTQALPPAGATGAQPQYQPPTQDQVGYQTQGLPSRAYDATGYQAQMQGYQDQGYQDQGYQDQGYQQQAGPEYHTQAIPRVGSQNYGGGPGGPDLLLATAPGKRQANTTILVALGVFVVLIVVAVVAFTGGGKSKNDNAKKAGAGNDTPATSTTSSAAPAPPGVDPEAKKQADAIYAIIAQSKELRSQANGAYSNVQACKNMPASKQAFADVAAKRQQQADTVKGQAVDKLPGGAKLSSDLVSAWQLSAESENDYVAWATDNLSCTTKPGANDNLAKANSAGTKAGTAKNDVVKDWNAFASQLGVQTIGVGDL